MKIFLDTSSLFKLYHQEDGTRELEILFAAAQITHIYLSELTKLEFASTVWKKVRTKEVTAAQAEATLGFFEADFEKYSFVATDIPILEQARQLVRKYGAEGLRTLDSIQLATSVSLAKQADVFLTTDKLLSNFLNAEGLNRRVPNNQP